MVNKPAPDVVAASPIMRSMLGRSRGLGSARFGAGAWWSERLTSLALIPLTLWFVWSAIHLAGLPRVAVAHWASNPIIVTLLVVLVAVTFRHLQLGLQAVIEDYVHDERAKLVSLLVMNTVALLLGLTGIISALRLAFSP